MPTDIAKKLKEKNLKMAPIDSETAETVKKLARLTNDQPSHIIKAAVSILAQAMGRKVILREKDSEWDLIIDNYSEMTKVYKGRTQ